MDFSLTFFLHTTPVVLFVPCGDPRKSPRTFIELCYYFKCQRVCTLQSLFVFLSWYCSYYFFFCMCCDASIVVTVFNSCPLCFLFLGLFSYLFFTRCVVMLAFWSTSLLGAHFAFDRLGGSVGCAVRLETRRSRVQPPPRSATFFRGDWSWNIFYGHSLPSADPRRAVVSFWRKNVHNTG